MKYIILSKDSRFGADYSIIVGLTFKKYAIGDLIPMHLKLYVTSDKRLKQWVLVKVEKVIENYYIVKVVNVNE